MEAAKDKSKKNSEKELAEGICKDFDRMSGNRGTLESHWEEIAQRMIPSHSNTLMSFGVRSTPGEKKNQYVFDSTAAIALNRGAAIMDSLLTPRNSTWHRMVPSLKSLKKDRATVLWFENLNAALFKYRYDPRANFASQNQGVFKSVLGYGTGSMFADKLAGKEPGLRYRSIHLGEIYFAENHQGIIDTAIRHFSMEARQILQKWGPQVVPEKIRIAAEKTPDRQFMILHCVRPRHDRDPERADYKGMEFASYYVAKEDKVVLSENGYSSFPYSTSRYEQAPGEVYGRSPAMDVLPAVKTLNEQKKIILKQGHRTVDPILLAHDDGIIDAMSLRPGAVVSGGMNSDGRRLVDTLPIGNVAVGKELMDDERAVINDAFLVTLFQVLTESPAMTATEVMERTREKGILLAPTIGRQQSEYLGPMIEREIDILTELRLLDPMPPALVEARGEYRIEYDSPLSRTQRAEEASGLMRSLETMVSVVNVTQNHEPLDHYNWDVIVPEINEIGGTPARWMNTMEKVMEIRAGRQETQETQEMIQGAPAAAAMIKAGAATQKVAR